jgi:hypothetical protein
MGAATEAKLEHPDQARELLRQAEEKWAELEANNPGNRAWHWPELTLCELVLEEARSRLNPAAVAER